MTPEELTEARKQEISDRARARDIGDMMNTAGWKAYQALLNANIGERTKNLFEPVRDNETLSAEHNKGVIYGLLYARDLPSTIVAAVRDERNTNSEEDD